MGWSMAKVPAKVADRVAAGIKRFQPILAAAKSRDVGESDTVTIVVDMLADVFGYDKYSEITSEHAIKGTFCDLATKIDGALQMLIEVKAIGLELKEPHVYQAINYAANQGVEWVVLTNAVTWRVYKVTFGKPIGQELVIDIDFCGLNPKSAKDIELLYLFCKEGWIKSALGEYHGYKQTLNRFFLGAMVLSEAVLDSIRKELKRISPDVRTTNDEIRSILESEVIKREVVEGEKADEAKKKISKAAMRAQRARAAAKEQKAQSAATDNLPPEESLVASDDVTNDSPPV